MFVLAIIPFVLAILLVIAALGCLQQKRFTESGMKAEPDWYGFFVCVGIAALLWFFIYLLTLTPY